MWFVIRNCSYTYDTRPSIGLYSSFTGAPSLPTGGWMSKMWRTDAKCMKDIAMLKWRPGQILRRDSQ